MVDNRAGAAGTIGAAHVAQQPADGHTLVLSNTAPIVERLRAETFAVLAIPEVRRRLEERGIAGEPLGPEAFSALVARQVREIGGLLAGLGMRLD